MKKKILIMIMIGLCLMTGCKKAAHTDPKEPDQNNSPESTRDDAGEAEQNYSKELVMKSDHKVKSEVIKIANGENTIYGTLYSPETDSKTPLIIMCHGYNGSGDDFRLEAESYAANGISAYTMDFCGGSANSRSSGETVDMTIFTEKSDLLSAFEYFKNDDMIDKNNIFLFGGSQGGLVTTLATEELGDQVCAMALYFPALCIADDWRKTFPDTAMIPESEDFWGMKLGKEFFTSIHDFNVFDEIGSYPNNVLILHGDKDEIVPLSYSEKASKLYKNARLIVLENEGHGFKPEAAVKAGEEVLKFMKANIR
ncbi:MAG: prolyl oligopeptidase family serine peptidase [Lachnospiraceae bacterium]|nr:prolyl oligopeptidase family serine peptidase [Lachnospiraceae bacterium]